MDAGPYRRTPRTNHAPKYDYEAKAVFDAIKFAWMGGDVGEHGEDHDIEQIAQDMSKARIIDANAKHSLTKQAKLNP